MYTSYVYLKPTNAVT